MTEQSSIYPQSAEHADPLYTIPLRFWWLKKISLAFTGLLVLMLAVRIIWGIIAEKRLQALLDSYKASGQLVYPEEFDALLDAVPDDHNAAIHDDEAISKNLARFDHADQGDFARV